MINNVTVKPRIKMTEVKEKIKEALERTAIEEAEKIKVEVTGNKVILCVFTSVFCLLITEFGI